MHCTANGVQRASFHASLTSLGCLHEPPLLLNAADSDSFLRLIESIVCTDHSSLCPLLQLCALGVDSPFEILRITLCSWMYKYIFQSPPCSFRHAHKCAGPHGKCMLNLGLGIHTRISILTGFWTGLPSLQQFTRLLFLPTQAVQATFCPANQGHPDGSISPCTRSLRWLVVLSTLYLFAQ